MDKKRRLITDRLFQEANEFIPGGVNSPVRSFKNVGGIPVFVNRARGAQFRDEEGREFIDYCLSWGALILGHVHPKVVQEIRQALECGTSFGTATKYETELAKLIVEAVPSIEQVRLTNSGTEAVMGAIRLARAYTGRDKIIKFDGAYHGHADYLLTASGSGGATLGIPNSLGVPREFTKHTMSIAYNDLKKLKDTLKEYSSQVAAIIVEPVSANCGVVLPEKGFLQGLRKLADRFGVVLIFDEVITGFRLSYGGAQEVFKVRPDVTCLGKIIGGGMPVGAFGGRKEMMAYLAPQGGVYQAGTLSGNPLAVTAGKTTLELLKKIHPFEELERKTKILCLGIKQRAERYGIKIKVSHVGSLFSVFFTDKEVKDYKTAVAQDRSLFKQFFHGLLNEGIYFSPSCFEADFISVRHSAGDIAKTLKVVTKIFRTMRRTKR